MSELVIYPYHLLIISGAALIILVSYLVGHRLWRWYRWATECIELVESLNEAEVPIEYHPAESAITIRSLEDLMR